MFPCLLETTKNWYNMWHSSFQDISHQATKESDPRGMGKSPIIFHTYCLRTWRDITGQESGRGTQAELGCLPEFRRLSWKMREMRQLEFAGQSAEDERTPRRDNSGGLRRARPSLGVWGSYLRSESTAKGTWRNNCDTQTVPTPTRAHQSRSESIQGRGAIVVGKTGLA